MEAVLTNDAAKLKAVLATKKHSSLTRPDDDGRVAYVVDGMYCWCFNSLLPRLFEACKFGYKVSSSHRIVLYYINCSSGLCRGHPPVRS